MDAPAAHWDPSDGILQGHDKVIYHTRLWETQRAIEARRRKGYEYDSDEQEFISGIDEHLTRATEDLHKVTEYLLTKP